MAGAARPSFGRGAALALVAAGLVLTALFGAFVVLYANVPDGYNAPYGLSLASPRLFRQVLPYPSYDLDPGRFGALAALLVLALWLVYLSAWAIVGRWLQPAARKQATVAVTAFTVLFHAGLVVGMSPVLSSDVYHYALFGRMVAFYGLNPFVTPGTAIAADPFFHFAGWREVTTHYGPVWTLISAGLAAIGGESILLTLVAFKATAALFSLANCWLVYALARRLGAGDGLVALLLYAWNPLVLIETAGSGHNDAVMMTFALLGLLLAVRGRVLLGLVALLLSVMVKYLTGLLLLFFVLRSLAAMGTMRRAGALAGRMLAVGAPLLVGLYLPFWAGPASFERVVTVGSPFKTPVRVLLRDGVSGLIRGATGASDVEAVAETLVIVGLHLAFVVLLLWLARRTLVERPDWPRVIELWGIVSLVYMGLVYGWNLPWFLISALATTCIALRSLASFRLLAVAHALAVCWMLPYALLIKLT